MKIATSDFLAGSRIDQDHGRASRPDGPWLPGDSAGAMGVTHKRVMDRSIGRPFDSGPNVMTTSLVRANPGVAGKGTWISCSPPRVSAKWVTISVGIRPAT